MNAFIDCIVQSSFVNPLRITPLFVGDRSGAQWTIVQSLSLLSWKRAKQKNTKELTAFLVAGMCGISFFFHRASHSREFWKWPRGSKYLGGWEAVSVGVYIEH